MFPHIRNGGPHDGEIAVVYPAVLSADFIDAVENDAGRRYCSQAVEVIKNGINFSSLPAEESDIPWRKRAMRLCQNVNVVLEDLRPGIEILLVPEFPVLQIRVTPFDTSVLPPVKNA